LNGFAHIFTNRDVMVDTERVLSNRQENETDKNIESFNSFNNFYLIQSLARLSIKIISWDESEYIT